MLIALVVATATIVGFLPFLGSCLLVEGDHDVGSTLDVKLYHLVRQGFVVVLAFHYLSYGGTGDGGDGQHSAGERAFFFKFRR